MKLFLDIESNNSLVFWRELWKGDNFFFFYKLSFHSYFFFRLMTIEIFFSFHLLTWYFYVCCYSFIFNSVMEIQHWSTKVNQRCLIFFVLSFHFDRIMISSSHAMFLLSSLFKQNLPISLKTTSSKCKKRLFKTKMLCTRFNVR